MPAATSATLNRPSCSAIAACRKHLQQHVPQLLLEGFVGPARPVERADGLDELVHLLHRVAGEALMGLLAIPGAVLPQATDDGVESDQLLAHRRGQPGDVEAGEVVGLDAAVEVGPGDGADLLVGQPEPLQHHDLVRARCRRRTA